MKQPHPPSAVSLFVILAIGVVAVSTAAILVRLANASGGTGGVGFSLVLAASRLTLAALALLAIQRQPWRTIPDAENLAPLALRYTLLAGLALALHFAAWITSLSYTSVAASTALVTTNPIWVALLSWLWLGERLSPLTISGTILALLGGLTIALGETSTHGNQPLLGNALALVGAWAASFYFLLGREAQRRGLGLKPYVTIAYSTAAILLLPLPPLFGTSYLGYPAVTYLYILLMALVPQLIGHTSLNWAMCWMSPTLVTLVILLEPIIASGLAFLLFQEFPGSTVIWGAGIVLLGVALGILGDRREESNESPDDLPGQT